MKNKKLLALICAALTISVLTAGCSGGKSLSVISVKPAQNEDSGDSSTDTAAELGSLKSFTATTLDGGSFTEKDIAARDVTVINFWSTMCGPCIDEMPELAKFARALPDNVQVVTACLDGAGMEDYVKSLLEGFEGVTILSGDGDYLTVDSNIQYTPTTVFVDSEGNFVGDAIIGEPEDLSDTFLTAVNAALKASGKAEISGSFHC